MTAINSAEMGATRLVRWNPVSLAMGQIVGPFAAMALFWLLRPVTTATSTTGTVATATVTWSFVGIVRPLSQARCAPRFVATVC